jgi:hypothetical protein
MIKPLLHTCISLLIRIDNPVLFACIPSIFGDCPVLFYLFDQHQASIAAIFCSSHARETKMARVNSGTITSHVMDAYPPQSGRLHEKNVDAVRVAQ